MPHSHMRLLSDQDVALHGPDDDDDVQSVDWVTAAGDSAQPFVAIASEPVVIRALGDISGLLRAPSPQTHDPPGILTLPPRAPPV